MDEDGHGTHVSGLACAATGDASAVAGAGWDCRIALMKTPLLRDEDIINGIFRAVEHGANAINMSFGGGEPTAAIQSAIDFAFQRGVVLVASASNDPDTDQGSPASQLQPDDAPQIESGLGLVVTAVDFGDLQAQTGRGTQISLAAYGFYDGTPPLAGPPGLLSTFPESTQGEVPPFVVCSCRTSFNGDERYAYLEGTSMAAPQVTATAAHGRRAQPVPDGRGEDPADQGDGSPLRRLDRPRGLGDPRRGQGRRRRAADRQERPLRPRRGRSAAFARAGAGGHGCA